MKILIYLASIAAAGIIISCSGWNKDKDRFAEAYKEILITRVKYTDTVQANRQVKQILSKYGYNDNSFKAEYFRFAKDHDEFLSIMDTARKRAQRDLAKKKRSTDREN